MPPIPTNLPVWAVAAIMLLLWLSREGVGAYLKFRKARIDEKLEDERRRMEAESAEDKRRLEGWIALVGELRGRVSHLEELIDTQDKKHEQAIIDQRKRYDETTKTLRDEHIACLKSQAESAAKIEVLQGEVQALRDWRHDLANKAQNSVLKTEVEKAVANQKKQEGGK